MGTNAGVQDTGGDQVLALLEVDGHPDIVCIERIADAFLDLQRRSSIMGH